MKYRQLHRTAGDNAEHVISDRPCYVWGVRPEVASTAGTITLRNQATAAGGTTTPMRVCPIGTLQAGVDMDGAYFDAGLTVQLSNGADLSAIIWETGP